MRRRRTFWGWNICTRPVTIRARLWTSLKRFSRWRKRSRGRFLRCSGTHPPTDDRIKDSQKNIDKYLKAKPEYVVSTSEFSDVKARVMAMHNHRKIDDKDTNRPRLRRAPGAGGTIDDGSGTDTKPKTDQDERPTLKRRDT